MIGDKRSYPRTTKILPYEVRRLPEHECKDLHCHESRDAIVIGKSLPLPVKDEQLNLWLHMLNAKLDYLISLTSEKKPESSLYVAFELVNISGSGMSLITKEAFQTGDMLEIKMILQAYPAKILYLYGEVVRVSASSHTSPIHIVGLKFIGMTNDVRDEILKLELKKKQEKPAKRKKTL
ncbi:MAG: PilZ domain-containing protein [Deltaproteobacteria bacterium]|nr:PilZ domain-containing protein [Deltaproteobacteria bacterium]